MTVRDRPYTDHSGLSKSAGKTPAWRASCITAVFVAFVGVAAVLSSAERQQASTNVLVLAPTKQNMEAPNPADDQVPAEDAYLNASVARSSKSDVAATTPLRFAILLPERPVTVGVHVSIDGKSFWEAREQAIERFLATSGVGGAISENSDEPAGSSLQARFAEYARVTGRTPTQNEIRWLMQKWEVGPRLLELRSAFQASVASRAPVFEVVDQDNNDRLSGSEIENAAQLLQSADFDRDRVLRLTEIDRKSKKRSRPGWRSRRLLVALHDVQAYRREVARLYAAEETVRADAELEVPELNVSVWFDTKSPDSARLKVTFPPTAAIGRKPESGLIELNMAGATLLISAAQTAESKDTEPLSIGGAASSAALFSRLDSNHDGRLTVRELRRTAQGIRELDRNADGQLTVAELPELVHFGISLGPIVHQYIERFDVRTTSAEGSGIAWFRRMDRNRDGDLTWSEFLGNRDQFRSLDSDDDGLVSQNEAFRGLQSEQ